MSIVHHHLIFQAKTKKHHGPESSEKIKNFLYDLVKTIDMQVLIEPQVAFSHQKAWTGTIGIITSHIAFHHWTKEKYLQLDIYSCKEFDRNMAVNFIRNFFDTHDEKSLFINRELGKKFEIIEKEKKASEKRKK